MTAKKKFFTAPSLAMAAIVATGMAAAPVALDQGSGLRANTAAAVAANSYDNAYALLGTTPDEAASEVHQVLAGTAAGPLGEYKEALRAGNLDTAARVLAQASNRPVNEALVLALNNILGADTQLIARQIADVAAARQNQADITMPAVTPDAMPFDHTALNVHTRSFDVYEAAARSGNLDVAAKAFAAATDRPITEDLVRKVNDARGVETSLTITQIAQAAAAEQKHN